MPPCRWPAEPRAAALSHCSRVLESLSPKDRANLVAIVDPPRNGLHADVLKTLRGCEQLRR
eukprot:7098792-Prymnesium_polylepis.1